MKVHKHCISETPILNEVELVEGGSPDPPAGAEAEENVEEVQTRLPH